MHKLHKVKMKILEDGAQILLLGQNAKGTSFAFDVKRLEGVPKKGSTAERDLRTFLQEYEDRAAQTREIGKGKAKTGGT